MCRGAGPGPPRARSSGPFSAGALVFIDDEGTYNFTKLLLKFDFAVGVLLRPAEVFFLTVSGVRLRACCLSRVVTAS